MYFSILKSYFLIFKIVIASLILLVIVFASALIYSNHLKKEEAQFSQNLQDIQRAYFLENNLNTVSFISKLEELDRKSLNRSSKDGNFIKLLIGEGYLYTSPSKGVVMIKKIAENESYDPNLRGYALALLANYYDLYPDNSFALKEIFSGDFFNQFIKENPEDISRGFKNINDYINKISTPAIITKYRLGLWYSEELLDNAKLSEEEKADYLSLTKENLKKADFSINIDSSLPLFYKKLALRLKAQALQNLYLVKKGNVSQDEVEAFYIQAFSMGKDQKKDISFEKTSSYARFYYAAFLAKEGGENANDKIKNILAPLYDVTIRNYPIFNFLKLSRDTSDSSWYNDILTLSAIDPRFKSLMDQL